MKPLIDKQFEEAAAKAEQARLAAEHAQWQVVRKAMESGMPIWLSLPPISMPQLGSARPAPRLP
jgi:hypothetical protein